MYTTTTVPAGSKAIGPFRAARRKFSRIMREVDALPVSTQADEAAPEKGARCFVGPVAPHRPGPRPSTSAIPQFCAITPDDRLPTVAPVQAKYHRRWRTSRERLRQAHYTLIWRGSEPNRVRPARNVSRSPQMAAPSSPVQAPQRHQGVPAHLAGLREINTSGPLVR